MSKKILFIFSFLIAVIFNFDFLLSMKRPPIPRSPRFRTSETLDSFLRGEEVFKKEVKCSICGLDAQEEDSIEYLDCGHRVHIYCAYKRFKQLDKDFDVFNCLKCVHLKD